jgi:acyl-[acyl carrier protein]--UDP-N-acetylglucosamine O-acyltransferase
MLYIYGATAHAKVAVETAEELKLDIAGLIDKSLLITDVFDYPVELHQKINQEEDMVFVAVLDSGLRQRIVSENCFWKYCSLIHPKAHVSKRADIGKGTLILPGASIAPDVQIGNHCVIGSNAVIASNTIVEDFVTIGPNSSIGSNVLIGSGSEISANIHISAEETIEKNSYIMSVQ